MKTVDQIEVEAAEWIVRLNEAKVSAEESFAFEEWLHQSHLHSETFERLSGYWLSSSQIPEPENARETNYSWWFNFREICRYYLCSSKGVAVAGGSLSFLLAVTILFSTSYHTGITNERLAEFSHQTDVGEQDSIILADHTSVALNTNSKVDIRYAANYRDVFLERGEAHFRVEKDATRPFRVHTSGKVIEAVGTAFVVKITDSVEVTVTEGEVKLSETENSGGGMAPADAAEPLALVSAGGHAIFQPEAVVVQRLDPLEIDKRLSWEQGELIFDGESLAEAVSEFERYTNTRLVISDQSLGETEIVGYFSTASLSTFLEALESSLNIRTRKLAPDTLELYRNDRS